ncbi:MAG: S8 family serine peptidase [Anaerolineae bacterium]|nr:S8 family serine peptidase [Anaerolineae bacterium]
MFKFKPNYPFYDGVYRLLPTPERVNADPRFTGKGVTIAFLDSGFYPHPDLGDRVLSHIDATSNRIIEGRRFHEPALYAWHGQMTSVIASGDGRMSNGLYRGIASSAHLLLIKVSTRRMRIKEPDILRGMSWLLSNYRRFNVRVINISLGGDFPSDNVEHPLHKIVRRLTDEGLIITIAAGNSGSAHLVPPASAPEAITVGGYDDRNTLDETKWQPYANNYGSSYDGTHKPEVIATAAWLPSPIMPNTEIEREARWLAPILRAESEEEINRLIWEGHRDLGIMPNYARQPDDGVYAAIQERIDNYKIVDEHHQHVDGTSVSAPIVASIIAQMLEANPRLTPAQVRAILTATSQPVEGISEKRQGAGRVDAAKAVAQAIESI